MDLYAYAKEKGWFVLREENNLKTGGREVKTMISLFIPVIGLILTSVLWIILEYQWQKEEHEERKREE